MRRKLIYDILKFALSEDKTECCSFADVTSQEWEWAYQVLSLHGLASLGYVVVERLPEDMRPPKEVLLKFISADMTARQSYARLAGLAGKIEGHLKEYGVKCLLLKGLTLARYYPVPHSRRSVDIDMYAPDAASAIDDSFREKGIAVDTGFYRHSHMTLSGVLVENHHCLLDIRGRKKFKGLDDDLKSMAAGYLDTREGPGLYCPDVMFSLIFNLHHAMSHFIYEGITFKFLTDWVLFLRREQKLMNTEAAVSALERHGLMKFAAVMTEVSVRYLGLESGSLPEYLRPEMAGLKPRVVERFMDDLFRPYEQIHHKNILEERIHNVRRIVKAAWKPKEFLNQNAFGFVWDKFLPILLGKKFEAD